MTPLANARKLATYIKSLPDLSWTDCCCITYEHMGATIADAGLQAGLNYRAVVLPRIKRILENYPIAKTTSGFLSAIEIYGLQLLIDWSHHEKSRRITEMALLFAHRNVETEEQLADWLMKPCNLIELRSINGIGPKTVDYIQKLVGVSSIPIDRHLRRFANWAGLQLNDYSELECSFRFAADLLGIDRRQLDTVIWTYVVEERNRVKKSSFNAGEQLPLFDSADKSI